MGFEKKKERVWENEGESNKQLFSQLTLPLLTHYLSLNIFIVLLIYIPKKFHLLNIFFKKFFVFINNIKKFFSLVSGLNIDAWERDVEYIHTHSGCKMFTNIRVQFATFDLPSRMHLPITNSGMYQTIKIIGERPKILEGLTKVQGLFTIYELLML